MTNHKSFIDFLKEVNTDLGTNNKSVKKLSKLTDNEKEKINLYPLNKQALIFEEMYDSTSDPIKRLEIKIKYLENLNKSNDKGFSLGLKEFQHYWNKFTLITTAGISLVTVFLTFGLSIQLEHPDQIAGTVFILIGLIVFVIILTAIQTLK